MSHQIVDQTQSTLSDWFKQMSAEHTIIALREKLTLCEMLKCHQISALLRVPLEEVFKKMGEFKKTSAHLLYKEDFLFA